MTIIHTWAVRHSSVVLGSTSAIYASGLIWLGLAALWPDAVASWPAPWRWAHDTTNPWPIAWSFAGMALFFGAICLTDPPALRRKGPIAIVLSFVSTLVLGLTSYWNHAGEQTAFFAPLAWTLALVIGNVEVPFTAVAASVPLVPLALQAARITGLVFTISALGTILVGVFRERVDRLKLRLDETVVVMAGVEPADARLIPHIKRWSAAKRVLVLCDPSQPNEASPDRIRELGGIPMPVAWPDLSPARRLLVRRRFHLIEAVYLMDRRESVNIERAGHVRDQLIPTDRSNRLPLPVRLNTRIDDPWQAEHWRRSMIEQHRQRVTAYGKEVPAAQSDTVQSEASSLTTPQTPEARRLGATSIRRTIDDALSIHEATAVHLLEDTFEEWPRPGALAVSGDSDLVFAILAELARRARELALLGSPLKPGNPRILLLDRDAAAMLTQHQLREASFGNPDVLSIEAISRDASSYLLDPQRQDDPPDRSIVRVIAASTPTSGQLNLMERVAMLRPELCIDCWIDGPHGLMRTPVVGHLRVFGASFEPLARTGSFDSWERAAALVHSAYRRWKKPDPKRPSSNVWSDLPGFYRGQSIRTVTDTLCTVADKALTWCLPCDAEADAQLTDAEIEELAVKEHEYWRASLERTGWRLPAPGMQIDQERVLIDRRNQDLVPWEHLPDDSREYTKESIRLVLSVLHGYGFHLRRLPQGSAETGPRNSGHTAATAIATATHETCDEESEPDPKSHVEAR